MQTSGHRTPAGQTRSIGMGFHGFAEAASESILPSQAKKSFFHSFSQLFTGERKKNTMLALPCR